MSAPRLDETHDPARRSWVESANAPDCDFPIQNLPLGVFRRQGTGEAFRGGVAIGNEAVFTRFPVPKDGRTGMDFLRIALGICRTAEDAVDLLGAALPAGSQLREETSRTRLGDDRSVRLSRDDAGVGNANAPADQPVERRAALRGLGEDLIPPGPSSPWSADTGELHGRISRL